MKNLSERIDVRAIVEGRAIPEILRSAQDDIHISIKESREFSEIREVREIKEVREVREISDYLSH